MYAEFTDDLITGNEMIDSQHKELISKINDLLKSCETSWQTIQTITSGKRRNSRLPSIILASMSTRRNTKS